MTTRISIKRPAIFRGVQGHCEVRFSCTFPGGETGYVSGYFQRFTARTQDDGTPILSGIYVKPGNQSDIPDSAIRDDDANVWCSAADITGDSETGLIIPVSKKEMASGTGAARHLAPSGRQVSYALSLCDRDGEAGGGNFYRPSEAEFRTMTKAQVSEQQGSKLTTPRRERRGFRLSRAGVPVSRPIAEGVSLAVLHQLRRHRRGFPLLRQDLPQGCSSRR
jgi:hypothetical protein